MSNFKQIVIDFLVTKLPVIYHPLLSSYIAISKNIGKNNTTHDVRFEVFTAVTMKKAVFWDVAPCHIPEDCFLLSRHMMFVVKATYIESTDYFNTYFPFKIWI
jgi:hypothetical protein